MFTGTLGLKGRTVVEWVKGDMENITTNEITEGPKINRKSLVRQAKSAECDSGLRNFFNDLPKMESHYCRASSKKLYLEPLWASKSSLYNLYKNDYCARNQLESVSNAKFYTTFNDLNLSLFRPKKDECEVCVGYRTKNISEEVYQLHQKLKDEARMQKSIDKSSCNTSVFTIDLQSVLLSPKTNVSTMYYKTKLVIHNLTIYNLKTKEVYCYLWNEAEGQLSANEFSSIVTYFLETEVIPKLDATREIVIYSDGCTCQNRNAILANALLHVASVHKVTVLQKYLLKGHTQMEVDSVHSCIERVVRNIKINLPADYVEICKRARQIPFPYKVKYLTHEFFKNFGTIQYYSSIRPGRTVGDPVVMDIKALKYEDGSIKYKLRHTDDQWTDLPRRITKPIAYDIAITTLPRLHEGRLKIKKDKYQHLMILTQGLEKEYHDFYVNLSHE
nr:unnamed protein product [Callosobruchus analis]